MDTDKWRQRPLQFFMLSKDASSNFVTQKHLGGSTGFSGCHDICQTDIIPNFVKIQVQTHFKEYEPKGLYHFIGDLLFILCGFNCFVHSEQCDQCNDQCWRTIDDFESITISVTRLGDILYFGQLFKAFGNK